jgi:hypothetical protein
VLLLLLLIIAAASAAVVRYHTSHTTGRTASNGSIITVTRPCHAMTRWRERGTLLGPAQGGARRPQGGALARGSRRRGLRGLGCKIISLGGGPPTCTTSYEEGERLARIANRALGPGDVPLSFRAASRVSPMQIVSARQSTRQNGKQVRTLAGGPSRRSQPPNAWPSPAS